MIARLVEMNSMYSFENEYNYKSRQSPYTQKQQKTLVTKYIGTSMYMWLKSTQVDRSQFAVYWNTNTITSKY